MKTFPTIRKKNETIVGIEITSHVIRMVRLRRLSGGRFSFESSRSFPIDPDLPMGSAGYIAVFKKGVKEFCGSARGMEIWTSLGAERVRIHHLKIPRLSKAQLSGAVYWAMKREESFDDDETVFDFELAPEVAPEPDAPYSVTGFLAPREDLDKIRRLFAQTGFPLTGLTLPLYALRNLFQTEWIEVSLSPVMVTHIGHRSSSVSILAEHRSVMTREIPIGLNSFAEVLTRELNPAPTHTEAIHLVLGIKNTHSADREENQWNEENVFQAIRPALERMARQIERTLEYCQTTYNLPRVERVYLAGTIAAIPRFTDFLNQQISAEVRVMDPLASDRLEAAAEQNPQERAAFTLPLSLALSGQGRTPNLVFTYKEQEEQKRSHRVSQAIFALFLTIAGACGAFYGWQQSGLADLRTERDRLLQQTAAATPMLNEEVVQTVLAEVQEQNKHLKMTARRYEAVGVLHELNTLTPDYIKVLRLSAGFDEGHKDHEGTQDLVLDGVTVGERASLETFLTIYVARLERSPLFHGVEVQESSLKDLEKEKGLFFTLTMATHEPKPVETAKK